jgi:hypothetical protein
MSSEEYRRNAARCLGVAEQMTELESKAALVEMASNWLRLAAQAEKNSKTDLFYETPPRRNGHDI